MKIIISFLVILLACPGEAGHTCSDDSDCLNGGECVDPNPNGDIAHSNENLGRYCICVNGYNGKSCGTYCPKVCLNGGECVYNPAAHAQEVVTSDYHCDCRGNFKGEFCEIAYIECPDGLQCLNGAVCMISDDNDTVDRDTYACGCAPSNEGEFCEQLRAAAQAERNSMKSSGGLSSVGIAGIVLGLIGAILVSPFFVAGWQKRKRGPRDEALDHGGALDPDGSGTVLADSATPPVIETEGAKEII